MRELVITAVAVVMMLAAAPAPVASAATPSLHDAVLRYLNSRHGHVGVAVHDYVANRDYLVFKDRVVWTASIVKVEILQALLHKRHGQLTSYEKSRAKPMIENSDNDAAEDLWEDLGYGPALDAFSTLAGLTDTHSDSQDRWGRTTTTARDQMRLVQLLERPNALLSDDSRQYVKSLMVHVESDQRWGASAHRPADSWFMIKNGWSPILEDHNRWSVNSVCYVRGKTKRYALVVLDRGNTGEGYAITTIEGVAAIVVKYMRST